MSFHCPAKNNKQWKLCRSLIDFLKFLELFVTMVFPSQNPVELGIFIKHLKDYYYCIMDRFHMLVIMKRWFFSHLLQIFLRHSFNLCVENTFGCAWWIELCWLCVGSSTLPGNYGCRTRQLLWAGFRRTLLCLEETPLKSQWEQRETELTCESSSHLTVSFITFPRALLMVRTETLRSNCRLHNITVLCNKTNVWGHIYSKIILLQSKHNDARLHNHLKTFILKAS